MLYTAWAWFVALVATAIYGTLAILSFWATPGGAVYQFWARTWTKTILLLCGIGVTIEREDDVERLPQAVFMANHTSAVDILSVFAGVPHKVCFIAKDSLFKIPILGWSMRVAGFVSVDRKDHKSGREAVGKLEKRLRQGYSIFIFPEGTRSRDGKLLPFKKSGFYLALKTGVPVVPMAFVGARAVIGKQGWGIRRGNVRIRIGKPIETKGLGVDYRNELLETVRKEILRLSGAL